MARPKPELRPIGIAFRSMLLLGTYSRAARLLFICDPASSRNRDFRLKRMKKIGLSRRDLRLP